MAASPAGFTDAIYRFMHLVKLMSIKRIAMVRRDWPSEMMAIVAFVGGLMGARDG